MLFESPPPQHAREDAELSRILAADQTEQCFPANTTISVDHIRAARLSMRSGKTCGDDMVVAEMVRETEGADWHWAASFNARIMNSTADDSHGVIADDVWDQFGVSLLPKIYAPTQFKSLQPIAILRASAK